MKLPALVLIAGLTFGCQGQYAKYDYDGPLCNSHVTFQSRDYLWKTENIMTITLKGGEILEYHDIKGNDLLIDYVFFTIDGKRRRFIPGNPAGDDAIEFAQRRFNSYLEFILKKKQAL